MKKEKDKNMNNRTVDNREDILCEIKGLMVDIYGNPTLKFKTKEDVDDFIDEVEKIFEYWK